MKVKSIVKSKGMNQTTQMRSILRRSSLAMAVSCVAMYAGSAQAAYDSNSNPIGDLSIYKPAKEGGANVMMMLDVSGSMGVVPYADYDQYVLVDSIFEDEGFSCVNNGHEYNGYKYWKDNHGLGVFSESITIDGETIIYNLQGCTPGQWGATTGDYFVYSRYYGQYVYQNSYDFEEDPNGDYFKDDSGYFFDINSPYYNSNIHTRYKIASDPYDWVLDNPGDWTLNTGVARTAPRYTGNAGVSLPDNRLDRMSRLKRALIQALGTYSQKEIDDLIAMGHVGDKPGYAKIASTGRDVKAGDYKIESKNLVGIGQFSANISQIESETQQDGKTGQILVAAQELTPEHRKKLIKTIMDFDADNGTPAANAYAEAGAYMRGAKTTGTSSGFANRVGWHETKENVKTTDGYVEPGTDSKYQCYGKGIFFLTDGFPNAASDATGNMMADTLGLGIIDFDNYTELTNFRTQAGANSGWNDIGRYAQGLRTDDKFTDIKTATVGFGKLFEKLKENKTTINVPDPKNTSLIPEQIIDCNADSSIDQDAINLCNWGSKENYSDVAGTFSVLETDKKWGGGGFTAAKTADDISDSLIAFIKKSEPNTDAAPGGTITVPNDPYRGGNVTPYAYLPMISPAIDAGNTIWQGNVKKYETKNGTLYGQNNERLYTSLTVNSRGGELRSQAADLWEKDPANTVDDTKVTSGGFYALLKSPLGSEVGGPENVRNVYVESYGDNSANGLTNIGVDNSGDAIKFDGLTDDVYGGSDESMKKQSDRILLNFLGYNLDPYADDLADKGASDLDLNDYVPSVAQRTLGGIIHSSPTLVSFSAEVDELGQITTDEEKRDEYLLFGSMDGSVHLVDATTGEEKWAIILQEMFRKQPQALVNNNLGAIRFGVDAPWLVSAKYDYKSANNGESAKVGLLENVDDNVGINTVNFLPLAAYGGFRMGGDGLYAIVPDDDHPKVLFSITPDTDNPDPVLHQVNGDSLTTFSNTDYNNVGQIWSRVTTGRLFKTAGSEKAHDVIIFGGGYDERYEDPTFVPNSSRDSDPTKGSSLYIADAKTGELIDMKMAGSGKIWTNPYNHSIVGGITTLDRDGDGYFDYLYFADLGGNVFRAAVVNGKEKDFSVASVTRVFAASEELPNDMKHLAYRFYNRPVVSFYRDELRGSLFAVVNVASGNKSSPLSKQRNDNTYANKVYGIIDREIATGSLLEDGASPETMDLTQSNLTNLRYNALEEAAPSTDKARIAEICSPLLDGSGNEIKDGNGELSYSELCKKKVTLISEMIDQAEEGGNGWYHPLTRFDGYDNVKNVKAFGDYSVIGGNLYISTYESDLSYNKVDPCNGDIKGASENQLYCLPYGICMDDSSLSGTGGYAPAGKGMQELTLGALNSENTNVTTLIGTSTIEEQVEVRQSYGGSDNKGNVATDCVESDGCDSELAFSNWSGSLQEGTVSGGGFGGGVVLGDGAIPPTTHISRYVLMPQRWYELNPKNEE